MTYDHPFLPGPRDVERCFTCGEPHVPSKPSPEAGEADVMAARDMWAFLWTRCQNLYGPGRIRTVLDCPQDPAAEARIASALVAARAEGEAAGAAKVEATLKLFARAMREGKLNPEDLECFADSLFPDRVQAAASRLAAALRALTPEGKR